MRLVHFADTHLGFRQFDRDTRGGDSGARLAGLEFGKNQREADVEASFRGLIDQTIALKPDAIVIGGDVFHSFRPSNGTLLFAFNEFGRLRDALPNAAIVCACGNHDLPLTKETATIVNLLASLGIRVADREAQGFDFPEIDLYVLAVPDAKGMVRPPLVPRADRRFNVLVMHGEVQGMPGVPGHRPATEIPVDDIEPTTWDYIALGHYHVYQQLAPNMYYSGSTDYTSTNPWGERDAEKKAGLSGKGFVERDLVTGQQTFHALPRSREHIDLTLSAEGMTNTDLSAALKELLDDAWVFDAIVRVIVTDCPQDVSRAVDHKMIKEFKRNALNLAVTYRRPEVIRVGGGSQYMRRMAVPLEQTMDECLAKRFANGDMAAGVSLEACQALSRHYLELASGEDSTLIPKLEASIEANGDTPVEAVA